MPDHLTTTSKPTSDQKYNSKTRRAINWVTSSPRNGVGCLKGMDLSFWPQGSRCEDSPGCCGSMECTIEGASDRLFLYITLQYIFTDYHSYTLPAPAPWMPLHVVHLLTHVPTVAKRQSIYTYPAERTTGALKRSDTARHHPSIASWPYRYLCRSDSLLYTIIIISPYIAHSRHVRAELESYS